VSFYWTLASGLTNASGRQELNFTNITDSSLHYNNINVTFSDLASMTPGSKRMYLHSYGYNISGNLITDANNQSLLTEYVDVNFLCYNTSDGLCVTGCGYSLDPDCTQTTTTVTVTTGGGGGGGGGSGARASGSGVTVQQRDQLFQTKDVYELVRGSQNKFTLRVENPFNAELSNVSVSVDGFLAKYLRIEPATKDSIGIGNSYNFTIFIESPAYFTRGSHDLSLNITGTVIERRELGANVTSKKIISMKESRLVTLIIYEVSKEDAAKNLNESTKIVDEMKGLGLNTNKINLLLSQAQVAYDNKNYEQSSALYEIIKTKKEQALATLSLLEEVRVQVQDAAFRGLKTTKTDRLILLANAALAREDFVTSLKRAEDAKLTYALETVGKFDILFFVENNWEMLSVALGSFLVIAYLWELSLKFSYIKSKLKSLSKEEKILLGLIQEIQKECFEDNKLNMGDYSQTLAQYENRINKVIQETIELETRKAHILRVFQSENARLFKERSRVLELLKNSQRTYLKSGNIETRVYQNRIKSYTERLVEIEERIAEIEAKKAIKKISR